MAISNEYPVYDGVAPSWADIKVTAQVSGASLLAMKDIKSIDTGSSVEVGLQRGASGGRVMKRTTGQATYEASMTLYRDGYQKFLRALAAVAPGRGNQKAVALVKFDIEIQHTPPGSDEIFQVRIKGCRALGRNMNAAEGVDAQEVEVPLSVVEIADVIDGVEIVQL